MERSPVERAGPVRHIRRTSVMADTVDAILSTLGPAALGVYTYLAKRCNRDGQCWPSYDTIAADCGIQRRYAMRVIKALEDEGFVVVERRRGRSGNDSNLFTLPHQRELFGLSGDHGGDVAGDHGSDHPGVLPIRKNVEKEPARNERTKDENAHPFDLFYAAYPRKRQRDAADRAWRKLTDEQRERVMTVLPRFAASRQWADPQYIPYPATWLNSGDWKDDPVSAPAAGGAITRLMTRRPTGGNE